MPFIKINTMQATQALAAAAKQIPFATAVALNDLAFQVQRGEIAAMSNEVFEHPRPFTARSTRVIKADKVRQRAMVYVRPEVAKYLAPYEFGGIHVLPGKALLKPVDIGIDQYGQLPKNTMQALKARQDIYIGPIKTKSGVINGVWQRLAITRAGKDRRHRLAGGGVYDATQGALRLLIRFGNAIEVKKRLDFAGRATAIVAAGARAAFASAIIRALR
jgi:hypothetical protein